MVYTMLSFMISGGEAATNIANIYITVLKDRDGIG